MLIASLIVKVNIEYADETAQQLEKMENVTTYGVHKEDSIIIVVEAETIKEIEFLTKQILAENNNVLGVFPTYLAPDHSAE